MRLKQTMGKYLQAFISWRKQEKLRMQRERLDEEVVKRKAEAAKLGITDMLLDIYKNGHGYQAWISYYESGPNKKTTFFIKGKSYTISWKEFNPPFDETTTITINLHASGKEVFTDSFQKDCDEFGLTYKINRHGSKIAAYVPGPWVNELRSALDAVAKREKGNTYREKHSHHPEKI